MIIGSLLICISLTGYSAGEYAENKDHDDSSSVVADTEYEEPAEMEESAYFSFLSGDDVSELLIQMKAGMRIAMTGTPIENDLTNLWSLFDFLDKGLLGSFSEFRDFRKDLEEKLAQLQRIQRVCLPTRTSPATGLYRARDGESGLG